MNAKELLDNILGMLHSVKDNKEKLQKIYDFMVEEIYEEPGEMEVPEKFKKLVPQISEYIDSGYKCVVNVETGEMEEYPAIMDEDPEEWESMTGESIEDMSLKHKDWGKTITFAPLPSNKGYRIMAEFAEQQLPEGSFRDKVVDVLNRRKPFANFKQLVETSEYREEWFKFKEHWLQEYVKEILNDEMMR